jgi:hypothetical protein
MIHNDDEFPEPHMGEVNGLPRYSPELPSIRLCKACGEYLVLTAAPITPMEGSGSAPCCSNCGSFDYEDKKTDAMQECQHNGNPPLLSTYNQQAARIKELEDMMRELEWSYWTDLDGYSCPICCANEEDGKGHIPDCRLDMLLNKKAK